MRSLKIIFYFLLPILTALLMFLILNSLFSPLDPNNKNKVIFEIKPNQSLENIALNLKNKKLIKYPKTLILLVSLSGKGNKIKAGEYMLSPSMSPKEILKIFIQHKVYKRSIVTLPGMTIYDIGKVLEDAKIISKNKFIQAAKDPILLAKAGISAGSFEGYLFPDKYTFAKPIQAGEIIWQMLEKGEHAWKPEFSDQADRLKLSRHDILTIASIIEKETEHNDERPIISSVIHNRIEQGLKLELKSVLAYGLNKPVSEINEEDLKTTNNYNTFLFYGLPPTPICNPSEISIRAALYPEKTVYLFFFKDKTGRHIFASTKQEYEKLLLK